MKEGQKKVVWAVAGVVVLAGLAWFVSRSGLYTNDSGANPSGSATTSGVPTSGTGTKPNSAAPKSYTDALKKYEGKRIQFDQYCQAKPTSLVFKNGVTIMLDNRSGDARTVKIGGTSYSLAGYGWRLVTFSVASSKLPARLDIDCGSAQNVSYIMLQK